MSLDHSVLPQTPAAVPSAAHPAPPMSQKHKSVDAEPESSARDVGHISMGRKKPSDPHATRWGKFLQAAIKLNSSDLIMKSDQVPKLRLRGALKPLDCEAVTTEEFWSIAENILSPEQVQDLLFIARFKNNIIIVI